MHLYIVKRKRYNEVSSRFERTVAAMKKFHLLLALALCLCMMTAFAESGPLTLNWEDVKALTEEDGSFW